MTMLQERDCPYCRGVRAACTCEEDCGARGDAIKSAFCPRAEGYIEYLRQFGYSDEQLNSLREQGYK
jgi:hypothetical protein